MRRDSSGGTVQKRATAMPANTKRTPTEMSRAGEACHKIWGMGMPAPSARKNVPRIIRIAMKTDRRMDMAVSKRRDADADMVAKAENRDPGSGIGSGSVELVRVELSTSMRRRGIGRRCRSERTQYVRQDSVEAYGCCRGGWRRPAIYLRGFASVVKSAGLRRNSGGA